MGRKTDKKVALKDLKVKKVVKGGAVDMFLTCRKAGKEQEDYLVNNELVASARDANLFS